MNGQRTLTHEQWLAEGKERYGADPMLWRFVCPACGHEARVSDWHDVGAPDEVAFSCVGRHAPDAPAHAFKTPYGVGPCNYAGDGLFKINPVQVLMNGNVWRSTFEFASAITDREARDAAERDEARKERAEEFR